MFLQSYGNVLNRAKTPLNPDADFVRWTKMFKPQVENRLNTRFNTFDAVQFTAHSLAGAIYKVKVSVGGDRYLHLTLFKPLPNSNEVEKVTHIEDGKTREDMLV